MTDSTLPSKIIEFFNLNVIWVRRLSVAREWYAGEDKEAVREAVPLRLAKDLFSFSANK
jgi:hypothetical protein